MIRPVRHRRLHGTPLAIALVISGWCAAAAQAIVTSVAATPADIFDGFSVNHFLGADRFYIDGYTGSRAIIANIEAGLIWNGHDSLSHIDTFFHATFQQGAGSQTGQFDRHATWVGSILGGRPGGDPDGPNGEFQRGIAHGATLWSASIAANWTGLTSFNLSDGSFTHPYQQAMVTGVTSHDLTQTADVINSSWGISGDANGGSYYSIAIDALINQSGKIAVFSAGNAGTPTGGANTVTAPASGFNAITVAALGNETEAQPFNRRSTFSSRSPSTFFNPQTFSTSITRANIDIAAPGENLTLAYYDGQTGGNAPNLFNPPNVSPGSTGGWTPDKAGTSFAAPMVAAGAALLVDAGKDRFAGGQSIDARVIKSVLLNSADKTSSWNNGQSTVTVNGSPVISTSQSLDYDVGAGRMNLRRAFDQYTTGTNNLPGNIGGNVQLNGWDFGRVTSGLNNDYFLPGNLSNATQLTVTLDWFVDRTLTFNSGSGVFNTANISMDNLDLEIWSVVSGSFTTLKARSNSTVNNVEHLHYDVSTPGQYGIRVRWTSETYDLIGDLNAEDYGLAWSTLSADLNHSGIADAADIDELFAHLASPDMSYDLNFDGAVSLLDVDFMLANLLHRRYGDANLDGVVDVADLSILRANLGATGLGWAAGNFNGSVAIDVSDLALLRDNLGLAAPGLEDSIITNFTFGDAAFTAIPEPAAAPLWGLITLVIAISRRRYRP